MGRALLGLCERIVWVGGGGEDKAVRRGGGAGGGAGWGDEGGGNAGGFCDLRALLFVQGYRGGDIVAL